MKEQTQRPVPQKPSGDRMTQQEVRTQWIYEHAQRIGVRLYPPKKEEDE